MKRKSGAKLSRSETVTVRLDPKLRYFAELAARKVRRTLSSFIEWSIEDSLQRISVDYGNEFSGTIFDNVGLLWDVNEADRIVKLAQYYPHFLNHQEQLIWKLIHEFSTYNASNRKISRFYKNNKLDMPLIKACWSEIKGALEGESSIEALKKAIRLHDDDIPF